VWRWQPGSWLLAVGGLTPTEAPSALKKTTKAWKRIFGWNKPMSFCAEYTWVLICANSQRPQQRPMKTNLNILIFKIKKFKKSFN
jgi:hypothetical protein